MDMPKIGSCDVTECDYNRQSRCHALAVTIGDITEPRCDTFVSIGESGGDPEVDGRVGACKMASCAHNEHLECTAGAVRVSHRGDKVDCMTYEQR